MANDETTTKFKVDISELKKAMQDARKQVAYANSEFKSASSTMEDWSKSSEGLSAKLKQLNSNLKSQETVLKEYEKTLEQIRVEYGENSKEALEYATKLNNQKAVVNKIKKEISGYEDALKEVTEAEKIASKTGQDVADVLADVGKEAEDAGDGFTTLKGAIATFAGNAMTALVGGIKDAIGSFIGLADETREYRTELAKLETAFTTAGFSAETATDTYKDLYAVLGDEGQAVEAVNHLAKLAETEEDLAKWTDICTGVYGTFGDSLPIEGLTEASNETAKTGQLTGQLADALNWAGVSEDEFQASLDKCTSEQERQALITETLNGLYSEASDKYKEVSGSIMDANRAQAELTDATASLGAVIEPVMTSVKLLGAEFLNGLLPSVTQLGQGFTDLMNGVDGAEDTIGSALGGIVDTVLNQITTMLPQVTGVALSLITTLITSILNSLPDLVTTLVSMIDVILESLSTALPEIVTKIVEVVPKIIDALMSQLPVFIQACVDFLSAMVEALPQVIEAIVNALPQLITSIINGLLAGIDALIQGAITLLMAIVNAIPQIIPVLINALPQIINSLIGGLLNAIPQLLEGAITLFMALVEAIPVIVTALAEALPEIIDTIVTTLLDNLPLLLDTAVTVLMTLVDAIPQIIRALTKELPNIINTILKVVFTLIPKLASFIGQLLSNIGNWIVQLVAKGGEGASSFVNKVIEFVKQLPEKVWTWLTNVVTNVASWGANLATKGKESAQKLLNAIVEKIKEIPDKVKSIGSDIVKGLWNGINDMVGWIKDKISGFGDSVLGALKDFFGINSPSKLMAEEVGKWLPEGIAVGIDKNAKSTLKAMKDLTMDTVGSARAGLGTATATLGVAGGVKSGVVNNFYQTINSPKQLSRLDIYRQSKNLLGYSGGGFNV